MDKEEIRNMFLIAAVRHMREDDPLLARPARLSAMEGEYFATAFGTPSRGAEDAEPDWRDALTYVMNVFKSLDGAAVGRVGPDRAQAEIAERHAVWKVVSTGVMNWYRRDGDGQEAKPGPDA